MAGTGVSLPERLNGGLAGHLQIVAELGEDGAIRLRQSFSSPFHISKPHEEDGVLCVQAVNATAGILAGDRLAIDVGVASGAKLLFTSPSAQRIFTMSSGHAVTEQRYRVASGAWLDVLPELSIPHRGCRYRQTTRVDVAPGGRAFFAELFAPGRVAHGEVLAFEELDWTLEVAVGNELIAREKFRLRADDTSCAGLRRPDGASYFAACYLIGFGPDDATGARLEEILSVPGVIGGWTTLGPTVSVIRWLAADSVLHRQTLREIRMALAMTIPELACNARKL